MSLDVDDTVPFLLEQSLVDVDSIVAGDLRIRSAARRNLNLRIERRRGPSYLIKQPDPGQESGQATLAIEAGFYALCRDLPAAAPVARLLPRLCHHDPDGPRLVLELVAESRNLAQELEDHPADSLPLAPHRNLGEALATLHSSFRARALAGHPFVAGLPAAPPWILTLPRPGPDLLARMSTAHLRTLRILQTEEELSANLRALMARWRPETLIHGDVKSDNVLVRPAAEGGPAVCLVDWELTQRGDPAWDVAGVLQDVLAFWILHMPQEIELGATERAAESRYPLTSLQPVVRAFWHRYRQVAGLDPAAAAELLRRAVPFSAARLIQTAYELAGSYERLPTASVLMLQVASNVLARPDHAAFHLYGLPIVGTRWPDAESPPEA